MSKVTPIGLTSVAMGEILLKLIGVEEAPELDRLKKQLTELGLPEVRQSKEEDEIAVTDKIRNYHVINALRQAIANSEWPSRRLFVLVVPE